MEDKIISAFQIVKELQKSDVLGLLFFIPSTVRRFKVWNAKQLQKLE